MSLFSLTMHGKDAYDQHSTIMGICTGSVISKYIYEKTIKDSSINSRLREATSNKLGEFVAPHLEPAAKTISKKILDSTINEDKLRYVVAKVKDHFLSAPKTCLYNAAYLTMYATRSLSNRIFGNQETSSENPSNFSFTEMNREFLRKAAEGKLSEAIQAAMLHSLTPICEESVQKAMVSATKAAGGKAYDFTLSKTCSILVLPVIYSVALTAFETLGNYYQVPTAGVIGSMPSSTTILGVSLATNIIQMLGSFYYDVGNQTDDIKPDKEEVKALALAHAKESMSKKIKENHLLTYLGINKTQEDIDNLVEMLVDETIDFYWKDLHEIKVMGLPLVS